MLIVHNEYDHSRSRRSGVSSCPPLPTITELVVHGRSGSLRRRPGGLDACGNRSPRAWEEQSLGRLEAKHWARRLIESIWLVPCGRWNGWLLEVRANAANEDRAAAAKAARRMILPRARPTPPSCVGFR
jgi:hypothetical protein